MRDPEEVRQDALAEAAARLAARGLLTSDKLRLYQGLKGGSARSEKTVRTLNAYGEYLYAKKRGQVR